MENVARLLVLCGSSLCYSVLASKALNGRILEISRLIVNIILVKLLFILFYYQLNRVMEASLWFGILGHYRLLFENKILAGIVHRRINGFDAVRQHIYCVVDYCYIKHRLRKSVHPCLRQVIK